MIVYHGSNKCFRTLKISDRLVRSDASKLNEGIGIYFSTDKDVASSYGKYVYTLEINNKYIYDFRSKSGIKHYIVKVAFDIYEKYEIDILKYIDIDILIEYIYSGNIAISAICREIYLILDSNESWYKVAGDKMDKVYKFLEKYDKQKQVVYLFNYNIKGIGVIKKVGDDIVRIISRERVGGR